MLFSRTPIINVLTCETCGSTGYVGFRRCLECKGMSMGRMTRGKFLYWGDPLTHFRLALKKARRWLNVFRFFGAVILGFGFWGVFFFSITRNRQWEIIFKKDFWLGGASQAFLFWLGVIALSYLFYRLLVNAERQELVEMRSYRDKSAVDVGKERLQTWVEARRLRRSGRKNIAATFTSEAKEILTQSFFLALKYGSEEVDALHVFYVLLASPRVSTVFLRLGVSVSILQANIVKSFARSKEKKSPRISVDIPQIIFQAYEEAYHLRQEYTHVTELLIATVNQSASIQEMLYDLKVDRDKLNNAAAWLRIRERLRRQYQKFKKIAARRSKYGLDRAMTAVATPYLNSFSQDLTMAAKYGYLAPCVARDEEIAEIFRIIEGGRQSVALVGEHGVGKMSIIEGIAQKMVEDDVPGRLKDKRLVQLSVSALLAGTTTSGAQERLIRIMREVARAKNVIFFIKNIHDLMGVDTSGSEGADVSKTLTEYLGPGRFLTLATAITASYNKEIVNSELGKVLARVEVKEMTENQAIQVLESKAGMVEYKHDVFFSYDSIEQCVKLSGRFLHDQRLPESALAIMTEAAGFVHNQRGANQLVTSEDVGAIVSQKTGIPAASITEGETGRLLRLEKIMHERVIGQEEAVSLVANALRRARVEIRSAKKPIAAFLFLGPTGVGKTELAKTIAEVYFGGEKQMIRVDMSEYQDKSGVYRLLGQPGQQGSGLLTEAVRQRPFSLILLDEMEKADPDILNLFLQVFDDGRLTDSTGRVIDFTNTIIIATSNAGTLFVQEQLSQGISLESIRQQLIRHELKQYYRPEFLNRFDGIVLFKPLNRFEIKQIANLMLKRVAADLEKRGVELKITDASLEALADAGFDPDFGARPMRRAIQDNIENQLAELVLSGKLQRMDVVVIGDKLRLQVERKKGM